MAKYPTYITPLGKNNQKAKFAFDQRSLYKNDLFLPHHQDNLIDFWYGNQNYGKLNSDNECVFLLENRLKQINADKTIFVLNFVADAYHDMIKELQLKFLSFDIPTKNTFLAAIKPTSGWSSVHHHHHIAMKALYKQLARTFFNKQGHGQHVLDFNSFMDKFMQYYARTGQIAPMTKTGFIKTKKALPNQSGLIISLADEDCSNDIVKFFKYINDDAFDTYYNIAKKYGFYLDKNAPWRLVANIHSNRMKKYMRRYHFRPKNLYEQCYMKASDMDIQTLQIYIVQFYNSYAKEFPTSRVKTVTNDGIKYAQARRTEINLDHILEKYDSGYWLSLYAKMRNIEQGYILNDSQLNDLVKIAIEMEKQFDITGATSYINTKFHDTAESTAVASTQTAASSFTLGRAGRLTPRQNG
tara:strand:+ start:3388 stop:4623 length:1236 start_codon:yes stop_codon:yes gene_type:complete